MEDQVDAEMKKLESMDEGDLEALKRQRMGESLLDCSGT
jgi:hypothetical protein